MCQFQFWVTGLEQSDIERNVMSKGNTRGWGDGEGYKEVLDLTQRSSVLSEFLSHIGLTTNEEYKLLFKCSTINDSISD